MSVNDTQAKTSASKAPPGRLNLSIDTWAVLTAFLLALLVRTGVVKHIPW